MIEAKKFLRRGAGDNAAAFEQDDPGSEEKSFAKIVSDEDDRFAKTADQGAEFPLKFGASDRIKRAERFVHQKNRRIGSESASDSYALTLAAGKFARMAIREFAWIEADKVEHFFDARGDAGGIPAFQAGHETDIFRNREMRKEASVLNDVADTPAEADGVPRCGRTILDQDFPFRGKQHPVHQFEERGLAAAAAAEENEGLTVRDF